MRYPVPGGALATQPYQTIVDTQGQTLGVILQNPSTVDVYVSEKPDNLANTTSTNLPTVGLHFPPDTPGITPFMLVLPRFNGKLYARSQASGAQMEAITFQPC
jgi:hypothetical protein